MSADKYAGLRPAMPRECHRADQVPKKRYTKAKARARAAAKPGYHHYRCSTCGAWHVGTDRDAA